MEQVLVLELEELLLFIVDEVFLLFTVGVRPLVVDVVVVTGFLAFRSGEFARLVGVDV